MICAPVSANNYTAKKAYDLREGTCKDYRKLLFPEKLLHAARVVDRLYSVEVLERRDGRVKIHYIGYDTKYDEWHKEDETVCPSNEMSRSLDSSGASALQLESYIPFNHHRELAYSIKTALNSSQKMIPWSELNSLAFQTGIGFHCGSKLT